METLSQKRCRFTDQLMDLLTYAKSQGYDAAIDQVKRTQVEANANAEHGVGIVHSLHLLGLAGDLLLYKQGVYLDKSEAYEFLGVYWEGLSPDARWGGRFKDEHGRPKPDGDHFSLEHNGVK